LTYALIREFSGADSLLSQRAAIVGYARMKGLSIDRETIEFESDKIPLEERKRLREFIDSLTSGDTIVVERIEVLASGMEDVILIINCILSRGISLHVASRSLEITKETGLSRLLPLIVGLKEQEESERDGKVGRPRGRRSSSKFDSLLSEILEALKEGRSVSSIARELGVSRSSLKDYIESRQLRKFTDESWLEKAGKRLGKAETQSDELSCTLDYVKK